MNIIHLAPIKSHSLINDISQRKINIAQEGISVSVPRLAESQKMAGNRVAVISSFPSEKVVSKDIYWDSFGKGSFNFLSYNLIFKKINKKFEKVDLLNIHDIYNLKQIFFSFFFIFKGVKIFITPRGAFSKEALKRSKNKKLLFLFFFKIYAKFIFSFVALNKGEEKQIKKIFPKIKIIIIGNGVNFSEKRNNKLNIYTQEKLKNNTFNIGFLGRFDVYIKGLDFLLNAYLKYQEEINNVRIKLHLLGEHRAKETDSKTFINSIKSKLPFPEMLEVRGPFYGFSKWEELAKLDILIQPSRTEGMPNTVLEAMATGIPCAVTDNTNVSELIIKASAGWKIKTSEKGVLDFFMEAHRFKKENLLKSGENAKKYAQEYLTWERIGKIKYF